MIFLLLLEMQPTISLAAHRSSLLPGDVSHDVPGVLQSTSIHGRRDIRREGLRGKKVVLERKSGG